MDIEEDIKKLKELNNLLKFFRTHGWIPDLSRNINTNGTIEAIDHLLAEREEDKKEIEKLKEEVETHTYLIFTPIEEALKDYIPKQKVKDKIEELKKQNMTIYVGTRANGKTLQQVLREEEIKLLEKLLEDK